MSSEETTSNDAKAVVVAVPQEVKPSEALPSWLQEMQGPDFWSSLDVKNDDDLALIFRFRQEADADLSDHVGKALKLVHVLAHPAEKFDEKSGEVVALVRCVLIDSDGIGYHCYSQGIRKSLMTLFQCYKLPPYNPPLEVEVKSVKTAAGFKMLQLLPTRRQIAKDPKKK